MSGKFKLSICLLTVLILPSVGCASLDPQNWDFKFKPLIGKYKLKPFEKSFFEKEENRWKAHFITQVLTYTTELNSHQINGETDNRVFLDESGHREMVYDGDDKIVTDCPNKGMYNYNPAMTEPLLHFANDMWPWLVLGGCRINASTERQRSEAYLQDLQSATLYVFHQIGKTDVPANIELSDGQWQVMALFFRILESSRGESLAIMARKGNDPHENQAEFDEAFDEFAKAFESVVFP